MCRPNKTFSAPIIIFISPPSIRPLLGVKAERKKRDEWNECERRRIDIKAVNNSNPLFPESRQCCLFYIHLSVVHRYEDVQLSS